MIDILIKNIEVIDPLNNANMEKRDIAISNGRICAVDDNKISENTTVINGNGLIAMPGLIDFHTHFFQYGSKMGYCPDLLFPMGVTAAVDAGSAGSGGFELFEKSILQNAELTTRALLNVATEGQTGWPNHPENINPDFFNEESIIDLCKNYKERIIGLKIRISKDVAVYSGVDALESLKKTVSIAESVNLPITVHFPDFDGKLEDIIDVLRPGDILCHIYNGKYNNIICDGKAAVAIKKAKGKGIIFDVAHARTHFDLNVAQLAIKDGILPDIISTDFTVNTLNKPPMYSLPHVMSKFLALGLPMSDVVEKCTSAPARLMGLEGEIGSLSLGSMADIVLVKLLHEKTKFIDSAGHSIEGDEQIVPVMTIKRGKIVYNQILY